jgi:hypothetical protein
LLLSGAADLLGIQAPVVGVGELFSNASRAWSSARRGRAPRRTSTSTPRRCLPLPHYTFIEPRMLLNENDMHPPFRFGTWVAPSTISAGERLIADVYNAIRRSDSPTGSNWRNTALVITFDEHGGTYDHVPPPSAVPPCRDVPAGQFGFKFDQLGVRVPMIVCSAYTRAGTIINTTLDSTSVIKTLQRRWELDP